MIDASRPSDLGVSAHPGFTLALVGPPADMPCGIADYVARLAPELASRCRVEVWSYGQALEKTRLAKSDKTDKKRLRPESPRASALPDAYLVHYERSRVPSRHYLNVLSALVGDRLFVVPHEVYREDPYAFPESQITGAWPWLWAKRLRYRWRHRPWFREVCQQQAGYGGKAVFALNQVTAEILRERGPQVDVQVIPHARLEPFLPCKAKVGLRRQGVKWLWGIMGFLTPGNDYLTVLAALRELPDHDLLLIGGKRTGGQSHLSATLNRPISEMGLAERVRFTGYVPEAEMATTLAAVDGFLCPFQFRSASGSVFLAMATQKPILVSSLPLFREMREQGAVLTEVKAQANHHSTAYDWSHAMQDVSESAIPLSKHAYPWSYGAVAEAYLQAMQKNLGINFNSSN